MTFDGIDAFLRHLATLRGVVEAAEHAGLQDAGAGLVAGAQAMIGEELREWPALAESTVAEKSRAGYTGRISATDPLYRTGELRASISYSVQGQAVILGTTDPIAPYQENGTSRIPPRPFISATMFRDGHAAADLVAKHMVVAFGGGHAPDRRPGPLTGG